MDWQDVVNSHEIRKMYSDIHLDKLNELPDELIEFAKKWIDNPERPSLFLTGNVGSGKTSFMTALLRSLVEEKGLTWFKFTRSVDMFDYLLEKVMLSNCKSNHQHVKIISEVPFLFLDDVGVETLTDRVKREYYSIIDYRVSEMLPFVFTSNLSKENFGNLLGDRVKSRLRTCLEVVFPKEDLR